MAVISTVMVVAVVVVVMQVLKMVCDDGDSD